ncbi:hypothetical protein AVEN_204285-1 [Araneus ventricosus]|uniref:Uncharacterized protein n=1 Tax=Araneus ventricosus TaxID=182803 RepID=A0A4Y2PRZ9_ARAVE|nr:hypothetical protein AVEN_204285-1 [Araneus ventricosus]
MEITQGFPILIKKNRKNSSLFATDPLRFKVRRGPGSGSGLRAGQSNRPYAPFGFESIKKQLWRNKQNDRPISDSEITAVLSQLFKTDQWLPPAGHVSEDVTSHA